MCYGVLIMVTMILRSIQLSCLSYETVVSVTILNYILC